MIEQFRNTYAGKKVFVTGHTGFKGAWLLKILSLLQADIKGYALAPQTENDLFHLIDGSSLCESVIGDLRDKKKLEEAIVSFQPDFIFHLAAQPLVRLSYDIPSETFEVNAIGTANLLDAVRLLNNKCQVLLITTDKVYHNNEWVYPYREEDRLGGYDPYSASKACAELVIDSYRNCFFNTRRYNEHQKAIAVARAGNVIGGGDWSANRLIPDVVRALGNNQSIEVRNPNSIRPWQHVLEPLAGYLLLGVKLKQSPVEFSQAYNFGPYADDALPVENMVNLAIQSWGTGSFHTLALANQPHEAGLLKLDISKAIHSLSWKPKMNSKEAVSYTMDWYKQFFSQRNSIADFTSSQILNYLSK
jgi:CDP-glucose 4,6-dehydratase